MNRRDFLLNSGALALGLALPFPAFAADSRKLLILIELKGGHDGLNTVVPYRDPEYYRLRPKLALPADQLIPISDHAALHPALASLRPLLDKKELAIIQGVGYPHPNLSHFRSIEIWDTASSATDYLDTGWLARALTASPPPTRFAADGIVVGGSDSGPLSGANIRTLVLSNPEAFLQQARRERNYNETAAGNPALAHLLKQQENIRLAALGLQSIPPPKTIFPDHQFGKACRTCAQLAASSTSAVAIKISLGGFDTHANQPAKLGILWNQFAEGITALRLSLQETGRWNDSLILTYGEFGRRPTENASTGTDHGTANVHFALGGKVKGGLHGKMPSLTNLENGNMIHSVDFRSIYATVLERHWNMNSRNILGQSYPTMGFLPG